MPPTNRAMIRGQMFDRAEPDLNPVALVTPISAPSSAELTTSRILDALCSFVVGLWASSLLTFRDYGLSWDDYAHAEYGDLLLKLYAPGFSDQRAVVGEPVLLRRWLRLACGARRQAAAVHAFETRRLIGAAVELSDSWSRGESAGERAGRSRELMASRCSPPVRSTTAICSMNPKDSPFARSQWRSSCSARCAP